MDQYLIGEHVDHDVKNMRAQMQKYQVPLSILKCMDSTCFIAGSFALSAVPEAKIVPSDVDIWTHDNSPQKSKLIESLLEAGYVLGSNAAVHAGHKLNHGTTTELSNAYSRLHRCVSNIETYLPGEHRLGKGIPIQLIVLHKGSTPQETVGEFDLSVSAVWFDGTRLVEQYHMPNHAMRFLWENPQLQEQTVHEWIRSFKRVAKYEGRGYTMESMQELPKIQFLVRSLLTYCLHRTQKSAYVVTPVKYLVDELVYSNWNLTGLTSMPRIKVLNETEIAVYFSDGKYVIYDTKPVTTNSPALAEDKKHMEADVPKQCFLGAKGGAMQFTESKVYISNDRDHNFVIMVPPELKGGPWNTACYTRSRLLKAPVFFPCTTESTRTIKRDVPIVNLDLGFDGPPHCITEEDRTRILLSRCRYFTLYAKESYQYTATSDLAKISAFHGVCPPESAKTVYSVKCRNINTVERILK